jgi:hypothetical protein
MNSPASPVTTSRRDAFHLSGGAARTNRRGPWGASQGSGEQREGSGLKRRATVSVDGEAITLHCWGGLLEGLPVECPNPQQAGFIIRHLGGSAVRRAPRCRPGSPLVLS